MNPPVTGRRVVSLDVFRGLNMLLMIFVNDLAGVRELPWWNYHMGEKNGMTYVDMVFPIFLFILGMSLPLAIARREAREGAGWSLWMHVLSRSAALIAVGLALANVDKGDPRLMGVTRNAWGFWFLIGAILFWNVYPGTGAQTFRRSTLFRSLKILGLLLMVGLMAIFRRVTPGGHVRWLDISYWEILGLIGWTYLAICIVYIPTRRWRWAPAAWLVLFSGLNIASTLQWLSFPDALPFYLWPFGNGAFPLLAMAGALTTAIFLSGAEFTAYRTKALWGAVLGVALLLCGWATAALGVSKNRATPAWCFFSAGAAVLIFMALHWICDIRGRRAWAGSTKAAGSNTLLTYLLPDLYYFGIGTLWIPRMFQHGWPGAARALIFTAAMAALATVLTRWRVRLHI